MVGITREELPAIFKRWRKPLRQWLSHRDVPTADLDDMAQEVFVRLLRYSSEAEVENIQGYIFRIAANIANEWQERARNRKPHNDEWLLDLVDESQPEAVQEQEDDDAAIARCIDKLPARQREVLMLHIHENRTYKEIADQQGMTYRMVLRDLTRAYTQLRELLGREAPSFRERGEAYIRKLAEQARVEQARRDAAEEQEEEEEARRLRAAAEEAERRRAEEQRQAEAVELLEKLEAHIEEEARAKREAEAADLLGLLEAHRWALRTAAASRKTSARMIVRRLNEVAPDWETKRREWMAERGKVPRSELPFVSDESLVLALEASNYNIAAAARFLGRSDQKFDLVCRRLLPDFDERRRKFLDERERVLKAEADKKWEAELQRRSAFFSEMNRKRWGGTADARRTEHLARLAQTERERAELIEIHAKEQTALALEEAAKIQAVEQEYESRRAEMRQRQMGERKRLTAMIHGIIALIPGYREHRRKLIEEKRATHTAQMTAALDATGGRISAAARLLGGITRQTVRLFKLRHWMNQVEGAMRVVLAIPVAMAERVMPDFRTNAPITTWELIKCPLCDGDVWVGHESREAFNAGQAEVCCITCAYTKPEGHRAYRMLMREKMKRDEDETEN